MHTSWLWWKKPQIMVKNIQWAFNSEPFSSSPHFPSFSLENLTNSVQNNPFYLPAFDNPHSKSRPSSGIPALSYNKLSTTIPYLAFVLVMMINLCIHASAVAFISLVCFWWAKTSPKHPHWSKKSDTNSNADISTFTLSRPSRGITALSYNKLSPLIFQFAVRYFRKSRF